MIDSVIFILKLNKQEVTIEKQFGHIFFSANAQTETELWREWTELEQEKVSGLNWLLFDADLQDFLNKVTLKVTVSNLEEFCG